MTIRRAAIAAACLLALPISADAAPAKHYKPKPHASCRAHYVKRHRTVREREHGKVLKVKETFCLYVAPKTQPPPTTPITPLTTPPTATPAPTVTLAANLDPTFTQNPTNPLAVTYQ
jgi:hypothetical protein